MSIDTTDDRGNELTTATANWQIAGIQSTPTMGINTINTVGSTGQGPWTTLNTGQGPWTTLNTGQGPWTTLNTGSQSFTASSLAGGTT